MRLHIQYMNICYICYTLQPHLLQKWTLRVCRGPRPPINPPPLDVARLHALFRINDNVYNYMYIYIICIYYMCIYIICISAYGGLASQTWKLALRT